MCLDTVNKRKPKKTEGIGYQVRRKSFYGTDILLPWVKEVPRMKMWKTYTSRVKKSIPTCDGEYVPGFHIFRYKKDAMKHLISLWPTSRVVVRVRYEDLICTGMQYQQHVIVARKVTILNIVEERKM